MAKVAAGHQLSNTCQEEAAGSDSQLRPWCLALVSEEDLAKDVAKMSTNTELWKHPSPTFRTPGSLPGLFFRCKRLNLYRWGQLSGKQKLKSSPCLDPPVAHRASRTKSPPPRAPLGYQIVHALTSPLMYSLLQTPGLLSAAGSFFWPLYVLFGFALGLRVGKGL